MKNQKLIDYVKGVESKASPLKVAAAMQGVSTFAKLPRLMQNLVIKRAGKKDPSMSFVVEPYSSFLAFEIIDIDRAEKLLPPGYSLIPSALSDSGVERPCAILGATTIHTSVFWGSRLEFYLVAKNQATGLLSWIILSYETNTASYDPGRGFIAATTDHCIVTTTYRGEIVVDVKSAERPDHISYVADTTNAELCGTNQRLWIEGNLSVDYGGELQGNSDAFSLIFDPKEMDKAFRVKPEKVQILHNTYTDGLLAAKPFEVIFFPFAQHFITTNFPMATNMRNSSDLKKAFDKAAEKLPLIK